nr:hypothetical protein asmbl_40 [uncultured bacterium]
MRATMIVLCMGRLLGQVSATGANGSAGAVASRRIGVGRTGRPPARVVTFTTRGSLTNPGVTKALHLHAPCSAG